MGDRGASWLTVLIRIKDVFSEICKKVSTDLILCAFSSIELEKADRNTKFWKKKRMLSCEVLLHIQMETRLLKS